MKILAIDQARSGAWSIFDYDTKKPIAYDSFDFPLKKYEYAKAIAKIHDIVEELMKQYEISAVYIEDIQLRKNVDSFKKLAQLQGALVSLFERNEYLYGFVPPSQWQSYCKARGRSSKELKAKISTLKTEDDSQGKPKKQSKVLSMEFVKEKFGIDTDNDNIADALCIGYYVVENVEIEGKKKEDLS